MTVVALRLADETVAAIDALVKTGAYATRTDAMRSAIEALLREQQRSETDARIIAGYTRIPQGDDEVAFANAATRALIDDEPW